MKLTDLIQLLENATDTWTDKLVDLIKTLSDLTQYVS
jgi:hypothetical protein